jgi:hypothetical protein
MTTPDNRTVLSPRERAELDWEKEAARLQITYNETIKQMDLDLKKLEVKWTQLFRLPLAILTLPIKLVMSLAIPISVVTKKDLPDKFWEFMR